jgi:hypothetical protein
MSVNLEASEIAQAFARVLADGVRCVSQDDELRLDTPYVPQDGRLLQVFLSVVPGNGHIVVSDGAYAGPRWRSGSTSRLSRSDWLKRCSKTGADSGGLS